MISTQIINNYFIDSNITKEPDAKNTSTLKDLSPFNRYPKLKNFFSNSRKDILEKSEEKLQSNIYEKTKDFTEQKKLCEALESRVDSSIDNNFIKIDKVINLNLNILGEIILNMVKKK